MHPSSSSFSNFCLSCLSNLSAGLIGTAMSHHTYPKDPKDLGDAFLVTTALWFTKCSHACQPPTAHIQWPFLSPYVADDLGRREVKVIETETQTQPVLETQDSDARSDLVCSWNPRMFYHYCCQVTGLKCIVVSDSRIL